MSECWLYKIQAAGINPKAIIAEPSRAGIDNEDALSTALIVFKTISGVDDPKALNRKSRISKIYNKKKHKKNKKKKISWKEPIKVTAAISSGKENSSMITSTAKQEFNSNNSK